MVKTTVALRITALLLAAACAPALAAQEPGTQPNLQDDTAAIVDTMAEMERTHRRRIRESVGHLERHIADLRDLQRRVTLDIAERQLRLLRLRRSLEGAPAPRDNPQSVFSKLDEMNNTLIRLTTLVTFLAEQHRPEDEADAPASDDARSDR